MVTHVPIRFLEQNFCLSNVITDPTRQGTLLDAIWLPDGFVSSYRKVSHFAL